MSTVTGTWVATPKPSVQFSRFNAFGSALGATVTAGGAATFGPIIGSSTPNATENLTETPIGIAGNITAMTLDISANAVSAGTATFTLRKNGGDTLLVKTFTGGEGTGAFSMTGGPIAVTAADRFTLSMLGATTGNMTIRGITWRFDPT